MERPGWLRPDLLLPPPPAGQGCALQVGYEGSRTLAQGQSTVSPLPPVPAEPPPREELAGTVLEGGRAPPLLLRTCPLQEGVQLHLEAGAWAWRQEEEWRRSGTAAQRMGRREGGCQGLATCSAAGGAEAPFSLLDAQPQQGQDAKKTLRGPWRKGSRSTTRLRLIMKKFCYEQGREESHRQDSRQAGLRSGTKRDIFHGADGEKGHPKASRRLRPWPSPEGGRQPMVPIYLLQKPLPKRALPEGPSKRRAPPSLSLQEKSWGSSALCGAEFLQESELLHRADGPQIPALIQPL